MTKLTTTLFLFIFFLYNQTTFGQTIKLANEIQCIDTSDLKKSLSQLDKVFKKSKIILLGESGHGDGATFQIKTKIVKYLFENYGYNVLALECAGFIETPFGIESIKNDSNIYSEFEKFWDYKWSKSEQIKELIEFTSAKVKQDKLDIWGFDSQPNSTIYTKKLFSYLSTSYQKCFNKVDTVLFNNYIGNIHSYFRQATGQEPSELTLESVIKLDSLTKNYISKIKTENESSLFRQYLVNISSNLEIFIFNVQQMTYADQSVNIRDSVMATNIFWYLDRHPNAKVIIWAANFHTVKDLSFITHNSDSLKYKKIITMGKFIKDKYPQTSFSIGFTSSFGREGLCTDTITYDIEKNAKYPVDNLMLEYSFKSKNCGFEFYNLTTDMNLQGQRFRSLLFGTNMHKGYWAKAFDGVINVDRQTPSTLRMTKK